MSSYSQLIDLTLPESDDALAATVQRSCIKTFHSVDRRGLPPRGWMKRVDQKIMGDVATDAAALWLSGELNLDVILYDDVRQDGFELRDPGWDISVSDDGIPQPTSWEGRWQPPSSMCTISIKSSRIPASDGNVSTAVSRRDFKILTYSSEIFDDLNADIEAQIYYDVQSWPSENAVSRGDIERATTDLAMARKIGERLDVRTRFGRPVLVGFAAASDLAEYSNDLPRSDRTFFMPGLNKKFWKAPLSSLARGPHELPAQMLLIKGSRRPTPIDPEARA